MIRRKRYKRCLLDADGVIVDYHRRVMEICGITDSQINDAPKPLPWSWVWDFTGLTLEKFWEKMTVEFWVGLDWTPDGRKILAIVEERFGPENVCILTNPSRCERAMQGKTQWMRANLPKYLQEDRYLFGGAKQFCANEEHVLIDDGDKNIANFVEAGGIGILVPRLWNQLYRTSDAVKHVKQSLHY